MRDDFSARTKDTLAKRVGFLCSNPECKILTIGPNSDRISSISIGVAAHITAASQRGPRFNSGLSNNERQDIVNAIWLCQSCSRLIDRDTQKYTVEILQNWKITAELEASERLNRQLRIKPIFSDQQDFETIKLNGYYEKELNGQKVRFYLDGEFLHIEHEQTEGVIAYYIIDKAGNIADLKWPFPLNEYKLIIDPTLILNTSQELLPEGLIKETIFMKWRKTAITIRNKLNVLTYIHIENGFTINHVERKIWIDKPKFN